MYLKLLKYSFCVVFLLNSTISFSQITSYKLPISTVTSQNGVYTIKSISYDAEVPNLKGISIVYKNGVEWYRINRSFDLLDFSKYTLAISDDGRKVIYLTDELFWEGEEFENVTVYKDGLLTKTYSIKEFTGCDVKKEVCRFIYDNFWEVIDGKKSKVGTDEYEKVYKEGVSEQEKYLSENYIAINDDKLYLTDNRKIVTVFDLNQMEVIESIPFDEIYSKLKNYEKPKTKISYANYSLKSIPDFVDVSTQKTVSQTIEKMFDLKYTKKYDLYSYRITLGGYLNKNGKFEIDTFDCHDKLDKERIKNYIESAKFESDFLSKEIEKQYFKNFFGGFIHPNDSIAQIESDRMKEEQRLAYEARKMQTSIKGIYIPKNLEECIVNLDSMLNFEVKLNLKETEEIWQFNGHLGGLGMWIRNNWGINQGSRLKKYFNDRDIWYKDTISEIIIKRYQMWLIEQKDVWTEWEKENPITAE